MSEEEIDFDDNEAYESSKSEEEEEEKEDEGNEGEGANIADIIFHLGLRSRLRMLAGGNEVENQVEPLVQDDSNYSRLMYWTCIQDSGFPNRVNHAVATHR